MLRSWFNSRTPLATLSKRPTTSHRKLQCQLEELEDRAVPAVLLWKGLPGFFDAFEQALTNTGTHYTVYNDFTSFDTALTSANPATDIIILSSPSATYPGTNNIDEFIAAGGRAISAVYFNDSRTATAAAFKATPVGENTSPLPVYDWGGSSFFTGLTSPITFSNSWVDDGDRLQPTSGGTAVAGFVSTAGTTNQAAIILGNSNRTIINGFIFDEIAQTQAVQLATNEIQYLNTNTAPVLNSTGGPYTLTEGQSLVLSATITDADSGQTLTVTWDIDNDGDADATATVTSPASTTTVSATLTWAQLQALSPAVEDGLNPAVSRNIRVRVSDAINYTEATTTLTLTNAAPTVTSFTATSGLNGTVAVATNPVTFQIATTDPSAVDQASTFTYAIDWNGDGFTGGSDDETITGTNSTTVTHTFNTAGSFTPMVRATDKDGGTSGWQAASPSPIMVTVIGIIDGNLVIAGSSASDNISVNTYTAAAVTVHRNGINYGPMNLSAGGRVIIRGGTGDDVISVNGPISSEVFGDDGNDYIYTGTGSDVVWGGAGNDYLSLGSGNDVGIGGLGRDFLYGGNDNDILIGGHLAAAQGSFTQLQTALSDFNTWDGTGTTPASLTTLRDNTTDPADANNVDNFWGNTGKDLFLYRSGNGNDQVKDYTVTARDYLLALL
jgi:hypothetical protein